MKTLTGLLLCVATLAFGQSPIPVFPHAVGHGRFTFGGGGRHLSTPSTTVYRVNTLSASSAGPTAVGDGTFYSSFSTACAASGPKVIIFETSGTIDYGTGQLDLDGDYVTVAGQTAPSPGITIRIGGGLRVTGSHVLLQHFRIGAGGDIARSSGTDPLGTPNGAGNFLYWDHLSVRWGTDENIANRDPDDMTVAWCITSEPLHNPPSRPGANHSNAMRFGYPNERISIVYNLIALSDARNPRMSTQTAGVRTFEVINNYIYGYRRTGTQNSGGVLSDVIGNYYDPGPFSGAKEVELSNSSTSGQSPHMYVQGNVGPNWSSPNEPSDWAGVSGSTTYRSLSRLTPVSNVPILDATTLPNVILPNAGARPLDRDPVDARIIDWVLTTQGSIIDHEDEVRGYPQLAVNTMSHVLPANRNQITSSGYTELELWLQAKAAEVEVGGQPPPPPQNRYVLDIGINPLSSGSVRKSPLPGEDGLYAGGTNVQLTADPLSGFKFSEWMGDLTGSTNPSFVLMDSNKSVVAMFMDTTLPPPPTSSRITFGNIGDFGDASQNNLAVGNMLVAMNPDFIFTNGDNNYPDGERSTWFANVTRVYGSFSDAIDPNHNRFFASLGNHDYHLNPPVAFLDSLALPQGQGNERYYDFVRGPVHFFALDSNPEQPDGRTSSSVQAQWLQTRLSESDSQWKVVYFHHAPFSSSSNHGSQTVMQWPFEAWGVDAVFAGHDHTYERLLRDENGDGTDALYIVNGLGGRSRYNFGAPLGGSQVRYNSDYGGIYGWATADSFVVEFHSISDGLVDRHVMTRAGSPPPLQQFTLNTNVNPPGSGSVSLDPPGGVYSDGTVVSVTATAALPFVFSHWTGDAGGSSNPVSVNVDADKTIVAVMLDTTTTPPNQFTLSVTISKRGSGSVLFTPPGGLYIQGESVRLQAVPVAPFSFFKWRKDLSGEINPVVLIMNESKSVVAQFSKKKFPVNLFGQPNGWDDVALVEVAFPSNAVSAELVMMAFDADHGLNDPPEGELYVNENPPISLFPDGTQAIGAGVSREVRIIIPLEMLNNGENTFRFVKVLNTGYNIESATVVFKASPPPISYVLEHNYPNPFNPLTQIQFALPTEGHVKLEIYNQLGALVETLVDETRQSGHYSEQFNAIGLSSGVYFYRLRAGDFVDTKKLLLLK